MTSTPRSRRQWVAIVLLAAAGWTPAQPGPSAPDPAHYGRVGDALGRGDANGDRELDADELRAVEAVVSGRHGERGVQILRQFVTAADTNADGRLTLAEWEALGRAIGAPEATLQETVMLPMQDGVRLATEIWRPASRGPFPVILQRTPYGRLPREGVPGPVRQGYAVVSQDMRGRGDSEGENLPFIGCGWHQHQDGVETLRWILRQSWCNGRVGTQGASAGGITQNLLAAAAPEGLACQYIQVAAASLYHHAAYVGGALRQCQVDKWLTENQFSPEALTLYRTHTRCDAFWEAFDSTLRHDRMTAPALHVGGWFDTFCLGTVTSFVGRQNAGGPGARGTQKLVLGPWAHGGFRDGGKVGELTFPNARAPAEYSAGRWFEHYLKGADNGVDRLPPVAFYVMGDVETPGAPGNAWRHSDTWPPPHTERELFLAADGTLSETPPAGSESQAVVSYTFDPADPCPTRGGGNLTIPAGPMDQRPVESRPDVVCFTTAPLAEPLEVTGRIRAVIYLASDAPDTDLSVRFCDVYPDGRSFLMAEGMLRARCRAGLDRETLLTPGAVEPLTVELWPTSVALNAGHRLRIAVTSSNYPRFDINPGTGRPWAPGEPMRPQRNTICCTAEHPSHIVLPVAAPQEGR